MKRAEVPGPVRGPEVERVEAEQFRLFVETVLDYAIFLLDPEGRVVSWNRGAERIKGYAAEEILGKHVATFYTEPDRRRGRPEEELRIAAEAGRCEDEGLRVRKDGSTFPAHVTITAVRDAGGRLLGFAKVTRDLTELKRGEEVRESERLFRDIAENIREVFWIADPAFSRFLYVSPAYEEIWGRPVEELYRDPASFLAAVHPDDRVRVRDHMETLQSGVEAGIEHRILRPDGQVRWLRVQGSPVRDGRGDGDRIIGVTEDITERREREEATRFLSEASRLLASSLDFEETIARVARLAVPEFADACAVDLLEDGSIRRLAVAHIDPAKEELIRELARRYPPDPDAPTGVARVLRTGVAELVAGISEAGLRQAATDEGHLRILREIGPRSQMILPMIARGRALGAITFIAAESGRSYGAEDRAFAAELADRIAITIDNARLFEAAEAARGEAERRAREERALRRATQAVSESFTVREVIRQIAESAIIATNADGTAVERIHIDTDQVEVVAVAGQVTLPLGERYPYAGSLAQRVTERGEPELIPRLVEAAQSVPAHWHKTCRDCSLVTLPLVDSGEAIGALILFRRPVKWVFRDDEIARAATFAYLASLAFRKVHLLEESEMRREELLEVMESRARLMRGFSHDVKNPIGAADGILQLLEEEIVGELTEKQRQSVARARRAIGRAIRLIDDLLEFARAEARQIVIENQSVDVREAAHEIAEEYRAPAEAGGLTFNVRLPDELPVIESDPGRIRQILGNLLSNAVKYTERGGINVSIEVREDRGAPGPGRWIAVDVADTGPGIPKEKQSLLFQEFKRIEPATRRGAGLGLAISKRIAHALHGDVTVQSESGRGSTFTLWLPVR